MSWPELEAVTSSIWTEELIHFLKAARTRTELVQARKVHTAPETDAQNKEISFRPSFLPHRLSWLLLWPLPSRATIVPMQRRDRQLALPLDNWRSAQTLWVVLKVERVCECSLCVYSTDFWTKVLKRRNFSHQRFMMEGCNEKWQIRRRTDVCVALCRCCENDDRLHILGSFQSLSFCIILTFYSNFWSFLAFASIFLKIVMC